MEKFQSECSGFAEEFIVVVRRLHKIVHPAPHVHVAFAQYGHLTFDQRDGGSRFVGKIEFGQQPSMTVKKLGMAAQVGNDVFVGQTDRFFFSAHAEVVTRSAQRR